MPARGKAQGQLQVRVRRRQDHDRIDRGVVDDAVEIAGHWKVEALGERPAPRLAPAEGIGDLDPIPQVKQAPGVGRHGHAETDDGDAALAHDAAAPARVHGSYYARRFDATH